eukprot:766310-Hanusia_phi.AAC.2
MLPGPPPPPPPPPPPLLQPSPTAQKAAKSSKEKSNQSMDLPRRAVDQTCVDVFWLDTLPPSFLDEAADLLNFQWPRSHHARVRSLERKSNLPLPRSLCMCENVKMVDSQADFTSMRLIGHARLHQYDISYVIVQD